VNVERWADQAAEVGEHKGKYFTWLELPRFGGRVAVPLVSWSRVAGFHATVDVFSNSTGVSMPRLLWRRCRLWKISKYSKIALASSTRVRQRCRSSSSTCIRDQNASIMALS
jgi:hypothetical protein